MSNSGQNAGMKHGLQMYHWLYLGTFFFERYHEIKSGLSTDE